MSRQPPPVIDTTRTKFGYFRTICDCPDCTAGCRHMPGYLIPADLNRIQDLLAPGEEMLVWARGHLLASPGALVSRGGVKFRIPTLVPARQADGSCRFLTSEGRCSIHAVAPFGCSFFDTHMSAKEAGHRSKAGLRNVLDAWLSGSLYADVWRVLADEGLSAPTPEEGRARMRRVFSEDSHS
jgi:hypothetical protein